MAYNKQNPINNPGIIAEGMKYVKYWYFFVLALVLSLGAAWLYLQTTVSKYKVSSTLLVQDDTKGDGLLKGTAFSDLNMFRSSKTVIDEMEVMRSRDLIQGVMKDLKMDVSYFYELSLKNKELYGNTLPVNVLLNKNTEQAYIQKLSLTIINDHQFILNENGKRTIYNFGYAIARPQFNITVVKGPAFSISDKVIQIRFVNLGQLAQAYSTAGLTVLPVIKDANTVVLSLLDAIPQRGIDILNALISRYNMENVNNKNIMALNTIKFIDGKLKFLTKNLSGVEQDVENYKRDNRITELSADAQMNLQSSGSYNEQLASSEVQLSLVQSLISYLRGGDASFELVPTTLGLKDPTLQNLTDKYNNLQIERERLLRNNSVNNPLVVSLTEQLSGLKGSLLENLTMIRRGLTLERNKLSSKTSQFESRLNHVPVMERGLLERSREQSVKTTLYQYLLQKREETELSLSATIPTSKLIDRPAYNPIPAKPKVQLIYMLSMMAGLMIPFSVIYLKDKLNSKVKDIYDVEYIAMNGKILGELSHKAIGESIVVHKNQSNTISELFRYIRSNLHFMDMNLHNKVLLVTSTSKGEGKTFFSINLGITLSLIDKKVVILEFDLRKPDLLNNMNLKSKTGLSDYLKSDKLQVDDILIKTPQSEHLFVIGCGEISDSPSEILMSPKLEILFKELRERFDYVIVDTSPVGHVADAFTIATFADSSIYLVRYNYTHKEDLAIFEEICENGRLKNPMIVFNDAGKGNKNAYKYGRYAYSA
ncbi:capsular exopolysaccharide family [Pedobacter steynii]|uniref:non-specific protein-tyrosine kinase n=1 Tax=Pedobacter steynii TaxID=430522 RepID=A0A1G9REA5_9SPHI|nr:tyrosine-protein kinase family protein [Pedobacter steynii]NQX37784.1 polysaccharide biosynthesis tyrosine autokinase [Pedobacter steynii]SDM21521.1 capsular exopolysaccharide family [Pedobacter steynii]